MIVAFLVGVLAVLFLMSGALLRWMYTRPARDNVVVRDTMLKKAKLTMASLVGEVKSTDGLATKTAIDAFIDDAINNSPDLAAAGTRLKTAMTQYLPPAKDIVTTLKAVDNVLKGMAHDDCTGSEPVKPWFQKTCLIAFVASSVLVMITAFAAGRSSNSEEYSNTRQSLASTIYDYGRTLDDLTNAKSDYLNVAVRQSVVEKALVATTIAEEKAALIAEKKLLEEKIKVALKVVDDKQAFVVRLSAAVANQLDPTSSIADRIRKQADKLAPPRQ